jgi:SAM-dependent methyltransferase
MSAVSRFNAWFFDTFDGYINGLLRRMKREVLIDLPDTIIEIGAGTGANFRYYRPGTTVVAIEPNPAMHHRLGRNARHAGIDLVLESRRAEDTGLETASVPVVVATLVLCTVADQEAAIAEILRILAPDGRLLLVEHVLGRSAVMRWLQRMAAPGWRRVFDGCVVGRDTRSVLEGAGFGKVELAERTVASPFLPFNSILYGCARR